MSDTIERTIWHKIRYTPIRDFLRGKLTGRMDLQRHLEGAALPPSVKQLVRRVVARTRLWRLEQLEVLQELIAHFADGIAAGIPTEQLIKTFGDESQAARLIRRAKRRNRPMTWQALRISGWSLAAAFVFYCGFAVYFFAGQPAPRINYIASVNQAIEKTPVEDRAWPLYRRALIGGGPAWRNAGSFQDDEEGPVLLKSVAEHPAELEWIRQGAAKSTLGFLIGGNGSVYDHELWPNQPLADPIADGITLPPLATLRNLGSLLRVDAALARQAHDRKRLLRDIDAILGLSHHVGENAAAALLSGLFSVAIYDMALGQIDQTLTEAPALLRNEDWITLAHRIATPKVASDLITFEQERLVFEEILQRSFTDDGFGNGRLTPQGVRYLGVLMNNKPAWLVPAVEPAVGLFFASRQELSNEHTRLLDQVTARFKLPMRDTDWPEIQNDPLPSLRDVFWVFLGGQADNIMPTYQRSQTAVEQVLGHRDGLVVAIALEIFRRDHGAYPESLNPLVPQYLSEVLSDRITGDPLRYRLVDTRPVVYSVGVNRKDDGGREPAARNTPAQEGIARITRIDGDWILYPRRD